MPKITSPAELTDSLSAPLGDVIAEVARGVAEAQQAMDLQTVETFKKIYGARGGKAYEELRMLGYQPTWYKIPEATAEITISLTISGDTAETGTEPTASQKSGRIKLYGAPVDANYTNRYNFDLKAASHLKFKVVPVPPTPQSAGMKVVPALVDRTYREACDLLDELDIPYKPADELSELQDEDMVSETTPGGGEILTGSQTVLLTVK